MYLLINQVAVEPFSIRDRRSCEANWLSVTECKAGFHQNKTQVNLLGEAKVSVINMDYTWLHRQWQK